MRQRVRRNWQAWADINAGRKRGVQVVAAVALESVDRRRRVSGSHVGGIMHSGGGNVDAQGRAGARVRQLPVSPARRWLTWPGRRAKE